MTVLRKLALATAIMAGSGLLSSQEVNARDIRLAAIALLAVVLSTAETLAQVPGYVRVKFVKAGVMVGAGAGSGVLTYRGRQYPFRVSGLSLGVTAGASANRLQGWASGIKNRPATSPVPTMPSVPAAPLSAAPEGFTWGNENGVKMGAARTQGGNGNLPQISAASEFP